MRKWAESATLVVAAILAVLRFAGLSRMSVWIDEAMFYFCSHGPLFRIRILETAIPPLYHLLANIFLNIRDSEAFLRLPAAIAGALSVPASYILAGEIGFPRTWRAAVALFVSASPWLLFYSQEGRSYSLLMLFCLLSAIAFLRLRNGRFWWFICGVFLGLALWSHYVAALFALALWAYALAFRREKPILLGLTVSTLIAAVGFSPWVLYVLAGHPPPPVSIKKPPFGELASFIYGWFPYFFGFSLGPSIRELRTEGIFAAAKEWPWLAAGTVAILLPLLKLRQTFREKGFVFCLVCALVPPVIVLGLSLVPGFNITYHPRYAAASGIFLAMAWLWLAMKFKARPVRWGTVALMISLMGVSSFNFFFNRRYYKEDIRSTARVLKAERGPGEPLYVASGNVGIALVYYYGEDFTPIDPWTDQDTIRLAGERVWLLSAREWETSPGPLIRNLERDYRVSSEWNFPGVRLILYRRN